MLGEMAKLLLLACSALFVLQGALVQGADPCALDGFDLSELQGARYWNVTLTRDDCLVPTGYVLSDVANCTVFFSICKPLPPDICINQTNSSTCQTVTTNDGKTYYFNIGNFQGNKEFQPTGGAVADVGFTTFRQGNASNAFCSSTFTTVMSFNCERSTVWNRMRNNATLYVENTFNFEACLLEMVFNYSGACYSPPTLPPNRCQLDPYDFSGLKREDYYFATLPNNVCLPTDTTACTIYFSFCQGLPLTIGEGCYEATVCQAGMSSNGVFSISMGQLDENTRFDEARDTFAPGSFYMNVEDGDSSMCGGSGMGISSRIILTCDPTIIWTDRDLSRLARVTQQLDCAYTITIPYAGACLSPASTTPAHTSTSTSAPSSTAQPTKSSSVNSTTIPRPTVTSSSMMTSSVPMPMPTASLTSSPTTPVPTNPPTTGPTTPNNEPTTPNNEPTTQKKPTKQPTSKPDSSKIAGLTAGLVIFMLIALVLLVLFIIAALYLYKIRRNTGEYERLQDSSKM